MISQINIVSAGTVQLPVTAVLSAAYSRWIPASDDSRLVTLSGRRTMHRANGQAQDLLNTLRFIMKRCSQYYDCDATVMSPGSPFTKL